MKKTGRALFLAVFSLLLLFPAGVTAYTNIDLSRVEFSSGEEPLAFTFGGINISGVLRQALPFTESEIEKLVKEALEESELTELDIKEANAKVEKARRASTFTKEDIARVKKNLLTTMETVPTTENLATLLATIDKYMTSKSWDDIGTASAAMLESSMTEKVKETAGGFLNSAGEMGKNVNLAEQWVKSLDSIVKFCDMLADEQTRTHQKWKDIGDGAQAKRLLNRFYERLQEKIDRYKSKSDQEGWIIDFEFLASEENLMVKVSPQSVYGTAGGYGFSVPGSAKSGLTGLGGQSGAGWEALIWAPWNGTEKRLKFSD